MQSLGKLTYPSNRIFKAFSVAAKSIYACDKISHLALASLKARTPIAVARLLNRVSLKPSVLIPYAGTNTACGHNPFEEYVSPVLWNNILHIMSFFIAVSSSYGMCY